MKSPLVWPVPWTDLSLETLPGLVTLDNLTPGIIQAGKPISWQSDEGWID